MPRSRRFFTDQFKKEVVFKIVNNMASLHEMAKLYNVDRLLLRRWVARYKPTIGEMPVDSVGDTVTVLNNQLDTLIQALLVKKMEQVLANYKPGDRQLTDTYRAHKAS